MAEEKGKVDYGFRAFMIGVEIIVLFAILGGVPIHCEGMSVGEFADKHPIGIYLIRISGHLTCIIDSVCYDLWNCLDRECDLAWQMR